MQALAIQLGVTEAASALQIAVRFPDDGGADEVVAAIGEQILGPMDVSLSNWTARPSSGCSVVLATHTAGVSVDGYTLTLAANPYNIVRTYNLTPGRELLFACRYRLGTASNFVVYMSEADNVYDPLYGSFVGDQGAWSTAKRGGEAALRGALPGAGPAQPDGRNGGRLRPPDPGRNPGGRQHSGGGGHGGFGAAAEARRRGRRRHAGHPGRGAAGAHTHHARKFFGVLQQQSCVASPSFTVGGFQLEGYAMTLSAFAWNIALRTPTPCRRGDATLSAAGTGWARPPTW